MTALKFAQVVSMCRTLRHTLIHHALENDRANFRRFILGQVVCNPEDIEDEDDLLVLLTILHMQRHDVVKLDDFLGRYLETYLGINETEDDSDYNLAIHDLVNGSQK